MGPGPKDDKEVIILGRIVRWTLEGLEYEADPKHRTKVLEHFGFNDKSRALSCNGEKDFREESDWDKGLLDPADATTFRGLSARLNFLSLDCPDLQFPVKELSRDMANPKNSSWSRMKKIARYLVNRKSVVWHFKWQDEGYFSHVCSDSN